MKFPFGNIATTIWKVVRQFRRELSPKEAHLYAYLLQHKDFNVTKKEVNAKVKKLRVHGYYSDPLMLFENFSANVDAVPNTVTYVVATASRSLCWSYKESNSHFATRGFSERTT